MDFIRRTSEKMNLWPVEHFFPPFFSRSVLIGGKFIFTKKSITRFAFQCNFNQSALIWKKTGEKSVQLVRISLFRKYFLWNPYFRRLNKAQYFYSYKALYDALYQPSQMLYLITLCCKTKHLRSLVQAIVRCFEWLEIVGFTLDSKLFSPELHKCYFLYVHKQIRSKVPILLYFDGPKRPSGNCYVSCIPTDKTALL